MATHRVARLLRLIVLLQSEQPMSAEDLTKHLGVSRRTLFRDLGMLEEAGVPYYYEPRVGYRIARTYYLPPINLNVTETLGLMMLAKHAAARRGPISGAALSAVYKLIAAVPEPMRAACGELMAAVHIPQQPRAADTSEHTLFITLQRCIDEHRRCAMAYKSPVEPDAIKTELHPYALHFAARAWYVIGHSSLHDDTRTFKLARIEQLNPLTRKFNRPKSFNPGDHYGKSWQMIPEGKIYNIELAFSPRVATNVMEVLWHPSQKNEPHKDGGGRVTFEVDGLAEIAWWICGYAGHVKVIKPAALRRRVEQMHREALEQNTID